MDKVRNIIAAATALIVVLIASNASTTTTTTTTSTQQAFNSSSPNSEAGGLKISSRIPDLVKLNDGFWLNCSYSLTAIAISADKDSNAQDDDVEKQYQTQQQTNFADIYAIKWYKGAEEFYRFLPNAKSKQQKVSVYETSGVNVDVSSKQFVKLALLN